MAPNTTAVFISQFDQQFYKLAAVAVNIPDNIVQVLNDLSVNITGNVKPYSNAPWEAGSPIHPFTINH
jgi:hypothetical protein